MKLIKSDIELLAMFKSTHKWLWTCISNDVAMSGKAIINRDKFREIFKDVVIDRYIGNGTYYGYHCCIFVSSQYLCTACGAAELLKDLLEYDKESKIHRCNYCPFEINNKYAHTCKVSEYIDWLKCKNFNDYSEKALVIANLEWSFPNIIDSNKFIHRI